ncbi:hypothetical protein LIER_11499 [Lithospermum erythrorhizon]|uniref:Uncharacterized protein n=1 Tax=Lithospermum erythrorhizon TaxID=34254 RepID=A0AAV3PR56_LITER
MVLESTSDVPHPTTIPSISIPLMLKRLAEEVPISSSRPSKRTKTFSPKKKTAQVLAWDSGDDATHSLGGESQVGLVPQQLVRQQVAMVDLDSSTTISDHCEERAPLSRESHTPFYPTNEKVLISTTDAPTTIPEQRFARGREKRP